MRHRRWCGIGLGCVAAVLLSACSGGSSGGAGSASNGKPVSGGTFSLNITSDPGSINPYETTEGTARQIYAFGYDTLVGRSAQGKPIPQLATKWTAKPDEVTYTLRTGITCQDGTKLTATDVANDFKYIKNPKTLSPWLSFALPIDYTVTADDAGRTVTIKTAKPFGLLLQGAGALPIVCPAGLRDAKSIEHKFDGTGPYEITSYAPGSSYNLKVRSDYAWGPNGAKTSAAGTPGTVKITFVTSETTAANQLLAGQLNAAQITGPDTARLDKDHSLARVDVPVIVGELNFNEAAGRILADEKIRQAMAMAMDLPSLAKVSTNGNGSVAKNMAVEAPPLCPGTTTGALPQMDVAKAKQVLQSDGWSPGADGFVQKDGKPLTVDLIYQEGRGTQTEATVELIAKEWKSIGVKAEIKGYTETAWGKILNVTGDYDVFYSGINLDFPFQYTDFFGGPTPGKGGNNFGSIHNPKFEALSAQALATEGTQGCDLWNKAQEALMSRVDVLPISTGNRPFYVGKATLAASGLFAVPTSIRMHQ